MATSQISTLSPVYTFSIRQRAGLQILAHAMQYVAGDYRGEAELIARLDAAQMCWQARERILRAAERRLKRKPVKFHSAPAICWRNPKAGA